MTINTGGNSINNKFLNQNYYGELLILYTAPYWEGRTTIRSKNLTRNEVGKKDISHYVHKNAKVSQVKSDLISGEKHQAPTNLKLRKQLLKKICTNYIGPIYNK